MNTAARSPVEQRNRSALLFILAALWVAASLTGGRIAALVAAPLWKDVVRQCATAVLLAAGLYAIARSGMDDLRPLSGIGFVRRPGARREFALGLALGWGIALVLVVPALLSRNLSMNVDFGRASLSRLVLSAVVLCAFALCVQLIVAGLPARLLVRTAGPSWTVIAMVLLAFCLVLSGEAGRDGAIVFAVLAAALFTAAFLRTRAIWLPLGLQLGWTLVLALLFGVAPQYAPAASGIVHSDIGRPAWLTGGPSGPEGSVFAPLVLILALAILYRMTREYAWRYTYQPIEGAGYPVEVQPPPAHAREEVRAAEALVQIGGVPAAVQAAPREPFQ